LEKDPSFTEMFMGGMGGMREGPGGYNFMKGAFKNKNLFPWVK